MRVSSRNSEQGFGAVEAVVALFLLGIIGVLVAAGLVQAISANARNTVTVSATQLVAAEINKIQGEVATCADLQLFMNAASQTGTSTLVGNSTVVVQLEVQNWQTCVEPGTHIVRAWASVEDSLVFEAKSLVFVNKPVED
jgi:type II secretory pathway pseudopilin PulG